MDAAALALSIVFFTLSLGLLFVCAVMLRVVRRCVKLIAAAVDEMRKAEAAQ